MTLDAPFVWFGGKRRTVARVSLGCQISQAADGENANARRERIWFSPHCLGTRQPSLFGESP